MSAVDKVLADEVESLTIRNDYLEHQNRRLAELLASALGILDRFQRDANDKLRHFGTNRSPKGRYDPEELLDR